MRQNYKPTPEHPEINFTPPEDPVESSPREKPEYIVVQDGEPITTTNIFPEDLVLGEYAAYVWIIRLSDLQYYWCGEWYPLKELKQQN